MTKNNKRKKHSISRRRHVRAALLITAALLMVTAAGCSKKPSEPSVMPTGEATPEPTEAVTRTPEPTEAVTVTPEPTEAITVTPELTAAPESIVEISKAQVGDTVQFGSYEQDNDTENGAEAIEWLVLDKQDGKLLLLSKYALDAQRYNEEYTDVNWEKCTLRGWLNSTFYNTAFSQTEQGRIATTKVKTEDNPYYDTEGGNDTEDKVFLLSIGEVLNYFDPDAPACCAKVTAYAKARGGYVSSDSDFAGIGVWWLRSPGFSSLDAAFVNSYGVSHSGYYVNDTGTVVRPAFWLNLEP